MPSEPFDKNAVLYRFVPSEEERGPSNGLYWDVAAEYVVEKRPEASCGIVVYYKNSRTGEWDCNPWNTRTLIASLLTDLAAVQAENVALRKLIDGTHADVCEILGEALRVPVDGHVAETIAQEAAEKMTMLQAERDALAHLAIDNELAERELIASSHLREPEAKDWRRKLSNGLCHASTLARKMVGKPSIREEIALGQGQIQEGK